jgi:N6-L-threonylcarbamoyladenine synthase
MKAQRIFSIETSCDETSVALLDVVWDRRSLSPQSVRLAKHAVSSQIAIHARYGGVVPEVAARSHVPEAVALVTKALGRDPLKAFDAIAVTRGPGLATALRVGVQSAQTLAWLSGEPIVGVNHLEGHLASAWLLPENRRRWAFPILALLVSGGHTEIVLIEDYCRYRILGTTRDDAAGEAFDKSAKLLGLGYPGGPMISKLGASGNPKAFDLPRPMLHDPTLDMSFSGLKTAIRLVVESLALNGQGRSADQPISRSANSSTDRLIDSSTLGDLCASIEQAIVDVLVAKTIRAAKEHPVKAVMLVGGVSANQRLREQLEEAVRRELAGVAMLKAPIKFSTDNAAMIAAAGAWRLHLGEKDDWRGLDAEPELDLS